MDINKENNELVYFLSENKILHKVRQERNNDQFETRFYLPLDLKIEDSKTKLGIKIIENIDGEKKMFLQFLVCKDKLGIISKIFNGILNKKEKESLREEVFDCINSIFKNKDKTKNFLEVLDFKAEWFSEYFFSGKFKSPTKPLEYFTQIWLFKTQKKNKNAFKENVKSIEDLKKTYVTNNFFKNERELIDLIKNEKDWKEHLELMYKK